jgi:nitrate/TMAO reductase-like tetraheme cytochrome c subunit
MGAHEGERLARMPQLPQRRIVDLAKQNPRAARAHETQLFTREKTCIDCHKGIAHRLPNMSGVPGWQ